MPVQVKILVALLVTGCVVFLAYQIKSLRRQRRNLRHWENNEPLEGGNDWD